MEERKQSFTSGILQAFLKGNLSILLILISFAAGAAALLITPREEEPQIVVPMVDVFVSYPGATPKEVEERVTLPMEKLLWEIKGVEYVYSIVKPGQNLTIVRFYVGENMEDSLVKLYNKLMSNYDRIPPGVSELARDVLRPSTERRDGAFALVPYRVPQDGLWFDLGSPAKLAAAEAAIAAAGLA